MEREYVGIDLHRRRSVIVRKNADGDLLSKVHIDNDPIALAQAVSAAGPNPEVVLEATFGWYWAADLLAEIGANVHLAHPLGNNWGNRRVKNDERDAADLVDLLRLGRLAEGWIAPPEIRELRELTRYRHKLMRLRSGLKAQVHAVMGKNGVLPARNDMFGLGGTAQLDALEVPLAYSLRLESLRDLIELYRREIEILDRRIHTQLRDHTGYRAIQVIHGVGPVLAAVFATHDHRPGGVLEPPRADCRRRGSRHRPAPRRATDHCGSRPRPCSGLWRPARPGADAQDWDPVSVNPLAGLRGPLDPNPRRRRCTAAGNALHRRSRSRPPARCPVRSGTYSLVAARRSRR